MRAWHLNVFARSVRAGLAALLLVAGCGGVDSGGTGAVSQGPIAGLGSIIVNGVRYDDSNALIRDDDGVPVARSRLLLGVMTRIDATRTVQVAGSPRATANAIRVTSELIGPVTAVDTLADTLTVLGQLVLVTPATVFESTLVGGLPALLGTTVEVYGRFDAGNLRYTATRIEARPTPGTYKLRSLVATVDPLHATLTMGGLTIDYSGLPPADRLNAIGGKLVRARLQTAPQAGVWTAVALQSALVVLPDRSRAEIEGRITSLASTRSFSVEGIPVDASGARFPDGEAGIVLGARVSAEGSSVGGVLVATSVEAEGDEDSSNSKFELHGAIETLDPVAKSFSVRGVAVDYSGSVQFSGGTAADLAVGRNVEVSGGLSTSGSGIAAREISFAP